ncbi:hypothetical protein GEV33_010699 [Tenebrio molitor]|uniref:Uncharacterized protein n=1 Tax=Tenebrio molitor TaxID=7067 RepID=A0A8J6LGF4_TENMO|nr:hypothetical protein GEV33_010699 [Tenebrio molitor]
MHLHQLDNDRGKNEHVISKISKSVRGVKIGKTQRAQKNHHLQTTPCGFGICAVTFEPQITFLKPTPAAAEVPRPSAAAHLRDRLRWFNFSFTGEEREKRHRYVLLSVTEEETINWEEKESGVDEMERGVGQGCSTSSSLLAGEKKLTELKNDLHLNVGQWDVPPPWELRHAEIGGKS